MAPQSINNVTDQYIPLPCVVCGRDLLLSDGIDSLGGIVGFVNIAGDGSEDTTCRVYVACKGSCDHQQERIERASLKGTGQVSVNWREVAELTNPWLFVSLVTGTCAQVQDGRWKFTKSGMTDLNKIIFALAQAVCRPSTSRETQDAIKDIDLAKRVPVFGA